MPRSISTATTSAPVSASAMRERAEARADLDDVVARADSGQAGDAAHGVRVADEVLAELAAGRQAVVGEQLVDVATRERHSELRTR